MKDLPTELFDTFQSWPPHVAKRAHDIRGIFVRIAEELQISRLDESLKWGQPAWRPAKGGTTLRMSWSSDCADEVGVFVDCKTDLCARMQYDFPDTFRYAPPRILFHVAEADLPSEALTQLARIAFCYKRVIPTI